MRRLLLCLLCPLITDVAAMDWNKIVRQRSSGSLVLGQSTRADVDKAWATPTSDGATVCVRGRQRGWVRADFTGTGQAAILRSLTLSAATSQDVTCLLRDNVPQLATGFKSGLRLGARAQDVLLAGSKLVVSRDQELLFENSGVHPSAPSPTWYQLVLLARFNDNRAHQLTMTYGETLLQ
jgi:hypothetical protein